MPQSFLNAPNTLLITLVQVIFVFPAPIALAPQSNGLLSERLKRIVQSVLYLPDFLSWVIVIAIFQQILGGSGLINNVLRSHGIDTIDFLGNPATVATSPERRPRRTRSRRPRIAPVLAGAEPRARPPAAVDH